MPKESRHPILQNFSARTEERSIRIELMSERDQIAFVSASTVQQQHGALRCAGNEFVNEIRLRPQGFGFTSAGASAFASCPANQRSITQNVTDIRKIAIPEAAIIPPITVDPSTRRATAPEPLANHNGKHPKINANEVIRRSEERRVGKESRSR